MGSRGYVFRYPPEPNDHSDHWVLKGFEPRTGAALPGRSSRSLAFEAWAGDVWDGWVPGGTFFGTPQNPTITAIIGFQGVPKNIPGFDIGRFY